MEVNQLEEAVAPLLEVEVQAVEDQKVVEVQEVGGQDGVGLRELESEVLDPT